MLYQHSLALLVGPLSDLITTTKEDGWGWAESFTRNLGKRGPQACCFSELWSGDIKVKHAQPRAHCPVGILEWGSGVARASLRRPHSPGLTSLNRGHAPLAVASHRGSRVLVRITPGEILPLAFRTSISSPAGRPRTMLGRPSSPRAAVGQNRVGREREGARVR